MEIEILKLEIAIQALVSSASNPGSFYKVMIDQEGADCTCPDHVNRGGECKHITAVKSKAMLWK